MSWLAISDGPHVVRTPDSDAGPERAAQALVPVGSLVIETLFAAEQDRPQRIVALDRFDEWQRRFWVTLRANGEVLVEHRQGPAVSHALLRLQRPDWDAALRLTYAWNAPGRHGLLTVENLDTGWLDQAVFDDPQPMPLDDIAALLEGNAACPTDPGVTLLACSDRIEPVGLNPGLAAGTLVDTAAGPRPVETLRPGDRVETAANGYQPVRCVVDREVPAFGRFAPIQLRAPFVGLTRDLWVAPDYRMLIAGVDAEYLFGADSVLVDARHLMQFAAPARRQPSPVVRYHQVVLDRHDCLSVAGTWGESLFLGDLADAPLRWATSALADIPPNRLPRHSRIASPQLKTYEAMVLVSALCA